MDSPVDEAIETSRAQGGCSSSGLIDDLGHSESTQQPKSHRPKYHPQCLQLIQLPARNLGGEG